MKTNLNKIRITIDPEVFISQCDTGWKVINKMGKIIGTFANEYTAKEVAVSIARRNFKTPRDYIRQYNMKLQSFEKLKKDME